jgi:hypothetical protein
MNFKFKSKRIGQPFPVSRLMESVLKEASLDEEYFTHFLKRNWEEIVGKILSTHSVPYKKYGGLLIVYTDHPVFANDLVMMKEQIIEKINKTNSCSLLFDLKVEVNKKIRW